MSGVALDHVGVVTRDLTALADQYQRLGFTLTPFARQTDGRIGNRCVMLQHSYLELLAVVDPNATSATLDRFLACYAGIHILAFVFDDEQAVLTRLRHAGIDAPTVNRVERPIDDTDAMGPRARFTVIPLPEQPEGRINLVHHLTPEALWQDRFLRHPNNAIALAEVTVVVKEPLDTAARFSRLVGCPVVPDAAGGFALDLPHGRVRMVTDPARSSVTPCISGVAVHTNDQNIAIGRLLVEQAIAHRRDNGALLVDADEAGGVAVRFVPHI